MAVRSARRTLSARRALPARRRAHLTLGQRCRLFLPGGTLRLQLLALGVALALAANQHPLPSTAQAAATLLAQLTRGLSW